MKTLRLIGMALFAVLMCVNFAFCSNDNETLLEEKEVKVSFGFSGEFEISESPLSRAISEDLYYIQIGEGNLRSIYAYGLFDGLTDMEITLTKGKTYSIFAFVMKGAKNIIKNENGVYTEYPFPHKVELNKGFIKNDDESFAANGVYVSNFANSFTFTDGNKYNFAKEIDFYMPTNSSQTFTVGDDETITIDMMRMAFGAEFIAQNILEGTLEISMQKEVTYNGYTSTFTSPTIELTSPHYLSDAIYGFLPVNGLYEVVEDVMYVKLPVSFTWVNGSTKEVLGTPTIPFKRNKKVTVKINVNKAANETFEFQYDDTELDNGGSYVVNGGTITEE